MFHWSVYYHLLFLIIFIWDLIFTIIYFKECNKIILILVLNYFFVPYSISISLINFYNMHCFDLSCLCCALNFVLILAISTLVHLDPCENQMINNIIMANNMIFVCISVLMFLINIDNYYCKQSRVVKKKKQKSYNTV